MELEAAGLQLGAVDCITKPPHAALVLARVRAQMEVKRLSDTLRGSVVMDFLTGTSNRLQFERTLHQEWERSGRSADTLCLLLMEMDGFAVVRRDVVVPQGAQDLDKLPVGEIQAGDRGHRSSEFLGSHPATLELSEETSKTAAGDPLAKHFAGFAYTGP